MIIFLSLLLFASPLKGFMVENTGKASKFVHTTNPINFINDQRTTSKINLKCVSKYFGALLPLVSPGYISLYDDSHVVNLYDINMTDIYNTDTMWLVQFYNHWCGHCQRFAPIWKTLAEDIKDWSPHVRVASINCADQSCDRYQIQGTPTTRIFHPNTPANTMDSAFYGFDIPVKNDKEYYLKNILYNIRYVGRTFPLNLGYESVILSPSRNPSDLKRLFDKEPRGNVKFIVFLFDEDGLSVGQKVILDMSSFSDVMAIKRLRMADHPDWGVGVPTKLIVINRSGDIVTEVDGWGNVQDRTRFTNILRSFVSGNGGVTMTPAQPLTMSESTIAIDPVLREVAVHRKDAVYQSDLEKAVQYSLMTEVANQPVLNQPKMKALTSYLDALLNFFPHLKPEMKQFLLSLLEWSLSMSNVRPVTSSEYKAKLEELSAQHQPFLDTAKHWSEGGCAGSVPEKRGYPCSLWSLFHSLMASSQTRDPAWNFGYGSSVARAMIGYITHFFSCRDCAQNFQRHVTSSFYGFKFPEESMLWLWAIHNKANMELAGDPTEDPSAPKIQWPSLKNCPACRSNGFGNMWIPLKQINGELWNESEVLKYLSFVYNPHNIVQEDKVKKILDELQEKLGVTDESAFQEAHDKLANYCQRI